MSPSSTPAHPVTFDLHNLHESPERLNDFYHTGGYLVLANALSPAQVEALRAETVEFCRGRRGDLYNTPEENERFRADVDAQSDDEVQASVLCIHQAHKASPVMLEFLAHPAIVEVLTTVLGPNVKCMQSMLFLKAAGKPGQAWHQDEDYIPSRDRSLIGAWIALDDATVENGCLWIIPGSQRDGVLWPQYPHKDPRFDCANESYDFPYTDADAVPVEVKAGSVVFFNGYLLHRSLPNTKTTGFRRALVNHYMRAESLLPWALQEGVPMAKTDYRDVVIVAGKDPYAYKGYRDIARPHVRPAGRGGCGDGRADLEEFRKRPSENRAFL